MSGVLHKEADFSIPALQEALSYIDSQTDPAIIIDQQYRILAANSHYQALYNLPSEAGRTVPQIFSQRCYNVSHGYTVPCDQAGEACPMQKVRETAQPARVLHIHQTPKGEEHHWVKTRPVMDQDHRIIAFIEVLKHVPMGDINGTRSGRALPAMVGRSRAFLKMMELVQRVAASDANALLMGESGTGKEMVARALHSASPRRDGPFIPVDCSGLTDTLFESELFGHEKGAFTGAHQRKAGLVEAAEGGTLFLDEVGDIPLAQQVKLLRLLETSTYRRVGSVEVHDAEFRLVCATHRNLEQMVKEGQFREDLYYRISTFPIHLPPLRERREDIPLLVNTLLERITPKGETVPAMAADSLKALVAYNYPGNVRQLRNLLERALLLTDGHAILADALPEVVGEDVTEEGIDDAIIPLEEQEQRYLLRVAARFQGEKRELAQHLGVSERTLYRKLEAARKAYQKKQVHQGAEDLADAAPDGDSSAE